jgi:hypothetical protein
MTYSREDRAPKIFSLPEEVSEALRESMVSQLQGVLQPLEKALNWLRQQAPARYLIPSVRHVVIGDKTIRALFKALLTADPEHFPETARKIGEAAGTSFADAVWEWFRKVGLVPGTLDALLDFWLRVDSSADWGVFEPASKTKDGYVIRLKDNFLTRGDESLNHGYCHFLAGYIDGFLWLGLKEYFRSLRPDSMASVGAPEEPAQVRPLCKGTTCTFMVDIRSEELTEAFDRYIEARERLRANAKDIDGPVISLRRSLDYGLICKFGLRRDSPWRTNLRACKEHIGFKEFAQLWKDADSAYEDLSGHVHDPENRALTLQEVKELAHHVGEILKQLELANIGKSRKEAVRASVEGSIGTRPR